MNRFTLCYHQVAPTPEVGRSLNVEPSTLASHIKFFQRRGYRFVSATELLQTPADSICLTFDDAYDSTLHYGLEVLQSKSVPATIYVVPGLVGGQSTWDKGRERQLADWGSLRFAEQAGIEIGNHTFSHPRLPELSREEERAEWQAAHERLTAEGLKIRTACYPYGLSTEYSANILAEFAYICAFSIKGDFCDSPFQLRRTVIACGDSVPLLLYKLFLKPLLHRRRA